MSDYNAPVKDMMFVLQYVIGVDSLPQFKSGDLDFETAEAILEEAGKLAGNVLGPLNEIGDKNGNVFKDGKVTTPPGFKEAYQEYYQGGWNAVPFNEEYGGQNLPWSIAFPVTEMWQGANTAFSLCPILGQAAVEAIEQHGSQEQKDQYLEKLISGEWTGTMNLTEPQAGSDLAAIKSKAEKQDDGSYLIKGQKIFITYGDHDFTDNIVHMVLARTPEAPEGVKGISMFIVPKFLLDENGQPGTRNDVVCTALEHKLGIHASPTCVMQYGEKDGATGYLVGQENEGLKYMFTMMNNARLCIGLQGVGVAERAFQHALAYAQDRVQGAAIGDKSAGGQPIIIHADVRRMLLDMKAKVEAGRMLAYEAAMALDLAKDGDKAAQAKADLMTPIVKSWCTDMAVDVASTGVQVHGGMGFIEETGAAQHYRDARIMPIYEGTNGIQANDLMFRKTVMGGGALAQGWFAEAEETLKKLASKSDFQDMHDALKDELSGLKKATDWVIKTGANDHEAVAGIAVPYQKAFGDIMGGFMMARAALAAQEQLDNGANENFYHAKIKTSAFYINHILPEAAASLETVVKGSEVVKSFRPDMFGL